MAKPASDHLMLVLYKIQKSLYLFYLNANGKCSLLRLTSIPNQTLSGGLVSQEQIHPRKNMLIFGLILSSFVSHRLLK